MKTIIKLSLLVFVLLVLVIPRPAFAAQGLQCEKLVGGGSYTLGVGESLAGSLCVFGGSARLLEGSTVEGDVLLLGGTLRAAGTIEGDLNAGGGNITLEEGASIEGDINLLGAQISGIDQAQVGGSINRDFNIPFSFDIPGSAWSPTIQIRNPLLDLLWLPFRSLLWAAAAVLVVLLFPRHVERVGKASIDNVLLSGAMGLATIIVGAIALVALAITIICIPFSLFGVLLLILVWAYGIIALGTEIGSRLVVLLKQDWAIPVAAGVGTFLLTLVINGIDLAVPCVGWFGQLLAAAIGIGAVILTRFGRQPYPLVELPGPVPPPVPVQPISSVANDEISVEPVQTQDVPDLIEARADESSTEKGDESQTG